MDLKGVLVRHKVFGEGVIKQNDDQYLTVTFSEEDKKFVFPDALENFLTIIDFNIASAIDVEIQKMKQLESEKMRAQNEMKKKVQPSQSSTHYVGQPTQREEQVFSWGSTFDLSSLMEEFFPKRETLLNIKRDQESQVKQIIEKRNIEYLVHFTRLDNLHSILQNGLVPVSIQQKMKIPSIHNDEQRIDMKLDCTSCSVGFPNYKLFYTFREYKYPGTRWVIIVLDKDVLFSPTNIAYYCHTNAAGIFPRISSAKELCTANAFENMFCDSITTKENKLIQRESLKINDSITTDPQAEILISDIIDTNYIGCICFHSQQDIDDYIQQNGSEVINNYEHQIVPGFFDARKDYLFWKKE